jgi:hypothetical protein
VHWATAKYSLGNAQEDQATNPACENPEAALAGAAESFEPALRVFDPVHMAVNHANASAALARVRRKLGGAGGDLA